MVNHRGLLLLSLLHVASLFDKSHGQDYGGNSSIIVRLFDPNSTTTSNNTLEGRLEIYSNGVWGTVCGDYFYDSAVHVVCASLGYGRTGRVIRNSYGQSNGNILFDYISCTGDEQSIADCFRSIWGFDSNCNYGVVAISCSNSSIFVRLFDPNSTTTDNDTTQGRLEIYFNGFWSTVCRSFFSDAAARVVCSSLGFGRIGRFIRNSYGHGNNTILFDAVSCNGNELSIIDCNQIRFGYVYYCNNEEAAVSCSNSTISVRLFDPNSTPTNDTMEGRLEIYYNDVWGTVCSDYISDSAARVVCASLGYGRTGRAIRNSYGNDNGNVLFDYVSCKGDELNIADCSHTIWGSENGCSSAGYAAISCRNLSIFTRLFDPNSTTTDNNTMEGRLEIYFNGAWGTVCNIAFSDNAARVVCSSLGFGRIGRFIRNSYGPGNRSTLLDYVACDGDELSITECRQFRVDYYYSCNNQEVALSCNNDSIFTRLFDPNSTTTKNNTIQGRLEIYFDGVWETVCANSFSEVAARVVCASLGFGRTGRVISDSYGSDNGSILFDYVSCNGNELSITDCYHSRWGSENCNYGNVAISCRNASDTTSFPIMETTHFHTTSKPTTYRVTTELHPCDTLPCVNGTCFTDNSNTATCACVEGYRGSLCEEDIAECDSDPCQHDSTCNDRLNSYQCKCLGGYTGHNCETEVNECESNPCPSNSICESSINRYQCICPNPNEFIGIYCNISLSLPEKAESPEFVDASPNHGPISGGTKITIKGRNLGKYGGIFFIYIGNMKLPITNWTSLWSEFSVVTTVGETLNVGQVQNLIFEITGGKNISSELTFTYYSDPEIADVKPTDQLASGGTTLTVIGNNLNSSASPYLQVILNTTTSGRLNKNITIINGPTCDASSSSEIYCLMPRVNVVGTTVVNQPGSGSRKRRDANSPNITTYMTLILKSDGAENAPNKAVDLIAYHGVLDLVTGPLSFNPEVDPLIHIKGGMLSDGIGVDDYEISVGVGVCTDKSLTANELNCRPPIEEPDPGLYQALYCSDHGGLPVIIFAGRKVDNGDRKQLQWACLSYRGSKFSWWIILIICVGLVLLLGFTVAFFFLRRRRSKRLPSASKQRVSSTKSQSGSYLDPANADWTETQVNVQGVLKQGSHTLRNNTHASRFTDDIGLNDYYNDKCMRNFLPDYCNVSDLQNPASVRYNHGLLSDDDYLEAAHHNNSIKDESGSEISAIQQQFGGNLEGTDNDTRSVAPALRANPTQDFLGQNSGPRASCELPSDY